MAYAGCLYNSASLVVQVQGDTPSIQGAELIRLNTLQPYKILYAYYVAQLSRCELARSITIGLFNSEKSRSTQEVATVPLLKEHVDWKLSQEHFIWKDRVSQTAAIVQPKCLR